MAKKIIYPLLTIILLAASAGAVLFYLELFPFQKSTVPPVEPETHLKLRDEETYMKLKYIPTPEIEVFDISMDYGGRSVLFGSNTKKVTFIDSDGMLKWEESFETNPLQTKVSSCGNFVGIGTYGGRIVLMRANQEKIWEKRVEKPVTRLLLSPSGRWLVSGSGGEAADTDSRLYDSQISFYDRESRKEWTLDTGPLLSLHFSADKETIFYTEISDNEDDKYRTAALDIRGEELWELPGYRLRAMSADGTILALQSGEDILAGYSNTKKELWRYKLDQTSYQAFFNPRKNKLLVYSGDNGKNENLFYFDPGGKMLWENVIAENALITFSSDGEKIIYITGRDSEGSFSKLILLDEEGAASKEFEITVQVEKVIAAEDADFVYLAGKDGSVYQIDLTVENGRE